MHDDLKALQKRLLERHSTRAFTDTCVDQTNIKKLLSLASHAPSGGNMQPWKIHVVSGEIKNQLSANLKDAFFDQNEKADGEYNYYPASPLQPYTDRIKDTAKQLYESLDIQYRDVARRREQQALNYDFFGAPVGLIITVDKNLEQGAWIDIGIYIGFLIITAETMGLSSCAAASFMSYPTIIRSTLNIPEEETIVCGIAIGYGDDTNPANQYKTPRASVDEFTTFHEDDHTDSDDVGK